MNMTALKRPLVALGVVYVGVVVLLVAAFMPAPERSHAASLAPLAGQLDLGSTGASVTTLQTFLAGSPDVYPQGLVSGYYGALTKNAVAQLQIGYGLPPVGRVGPETLELINQIIASGASAPDVSAPVMTSNPQVTTTATTATITWTTNESAIGSVNYDLTPITILEVSAAHQEPQTSGTRVAESAAGFSHSITITGLMPGHSYFASTESRDSTGNVTVTLSMPFTTQP